MMTKLLLLGTLVAATTGCMVRASAPGVSLAIGTPVPVAVERPFYRRPWRERAFYGPPVYRVRRTCSPEYGCVRRWY